jgi:NAD+ synthetase
VAGRVAKQLLPAYDVFHENRWFTPGPPAAPIEIAGERLGILVCEDMWDLDYAVHPPARLREQGASVLVCLSASPFRRGVHERRLGHARRAGGGGVPVVYVNAVGAQDELVFDGRSFVVDPAGRTVAALPAFEEEVRVVDLSARPLECEPPDEDGQVFRALVLGVRDFVAKNRMPRVFVGLSGGVDSALVACIAAEAVGPGRVEAVALPSRWTDPRSTDTARELAERLGIGFEVIPIDRVHEALGDVLGGACGVVDENLQARVRATLLMTRVNARRGMLLNTSNKTELSLGYGTLYGDMAGALAVIGDLTKPQVYDLARRDGRIPRFILERAPSAELRAGQVDPFDYPVVAPEVEAIVRGAAPRSGALRGRVRGAEHKRWQAPIVLKVSDRAFGSGRMVPVTHHFHWRDEHGDLAGADSPVDLLAAAAVP